MSSVQAVREAKSQSSASVEVVPMAIHIGAEIRGVDLSRPLPAEHVSAVRNALLRWKVVFFRDQALDHRSHIAAARHFGETTAGHVVYGSDGEYPQIYSVAKHRKANRYQGQAVFRPWTGWHTDITAAINPPAASMLRGEVVRDGQTFTQTKRILVRAGEEAQVSLTDLTKQAAPGPEIASAR